MAYSNPRLAAIACERMRGCVFAENFISEERVTANGSTGYYGPGVVIDRGLTIDETPLNAGIIFDHVRLEDECTAVVRFSAEQLATDDDLLVGNVVMLASTVMGFAIWVDADGVKASYCDGSTKETTLEVDLNYADGEIHTVSYSFNNTDNTHTLRVDSLDPATASTTVQDDLTGWNLCVGGGTISYPDNLFIGTIYKVRIFAAQLESEEHDQYVDDDLVSFFERPYAKYRCDSYGNDTNGHKVWCKGKSNTTLRDLGKGNQDPGRSSGVNETFPTFWEEPYDTGAYFFNGAFAYLSNLAELPDEYTITAVLSDNLDLAAFPEFVSYEDDSALLDDLTTAGGFVGVLHNLVIWEGHLTPLQLLHAKYEQLRHVRRGWARGLVNRLWAEGVLAFWSPFQAETMAFVDHAAVIQGDAGDVTKDSPNSCVWNTGNSYIDYEHDAIQQCRDISIVVFGDVGDIGTGSPDTLVDKGLGYKLTATDNGTPALQVYINSSGYTHTSMPESTIGVSLKAGEDPRYFIDGEYGGDGAAPITPDANTTETLTIGNSNEHNDGHAIGLKQVAIASVALTDNEMLALHNSMHAMEEMGMETGNRIVARTTHTGAIDETINPGGPFQLIEVNFLLSASPSTSESATIKRVNASAEEFDQITANEGNFTLTGMDTTQLYRFDKRFADGNTIHVEHTNTDALTITLEVVYQMDQSVV